MSNNEISLIGQPSSAEIAAELSGNKSLRYALHTSSGARKRASQAIGEHRESEIRSYLPLSTGKCPSELLTNGPEKSFSDLVKSQKCVGDSRTGWSVEPLQEADYADLLYSFNSYYWGEEIAKVISTWEGSSNILSTKSTSQAGHVEGGPKKYAYDLGIQLAHFPPPTTPTTSTFQDQDRDQDRNNKRSQLLSTAKGFSTDHSDKWKELWKVDEEHGSKIYDHFIACTKANTNVSTNTGTRGSTNPSRRAHFKDRMSRFLGSDPHSDTAINRNAHQEQDQALITGNTSRSRRTAYDDEDQSSSIYNLDQSRNSLDSFDGNGNGQAGTSSYSSPWSIV